jgi:tetratricopeptide (TPR) repeat protein
LVRQQEGRPDAALRSFRAALKINPRFAPAQARVCELETAYDAKLAACRRAIQLDAKDPEPHFHAGWTQAKLGNHAAAIQEYKSVLSLDPKFPGVNYELAVAYLDSQDIDHAIPLLKQEQANPNARFQLGSALVKKGDCAAAVPVLETATEIAQKHYLLAGCYKKMGREAESAAEFAKVKQLREGAGARMQAKYRAAVAHQKAEAGKLDEAIAEYRAALELASDPTIAIDLAVALLKKGQPEQVVHLLAKETDPLARYQVALAYTKLGRQEEARAALEQAVRDKPAFVEAWYQLGVTLLALRKPGQAEPALQTAVRLRPDEAPLRLAWAEALDAIGQSQEARAQRQLAARLPK